MTICKALKDQRLSQKKAVFFVCVFFEGNLKEVCQKDNTQRLLSKIMDNKLGNIYRQCRGFSHF